MRACPSCGETIQESARKCRFCKAWFDEGPAEELDNPDALTCPWCRTGEATRDQVSQRCGDCGKPFRFHVGCWLDKRIQPPGIHGPAITARFSGLLQHRRAEVGLEGITLSNLDPVVAMSAIDGETVFYDELVSLTTWNRWDKMTLAIGTLFFLPIALLLGGAVLDEAGWMIVGVPWWLATAGVYWRGIGAGASYMRACSFDQTLEFRFDVPIWRRKRFYQEALQRAGIPDPPR